MSLFSYPGTNLWQSIQLLRNEKSFFFSSRLNKICQITLQFYFCQQYKMIFFVYGSSAGFFFPPQLSSKPKYSKCMTTLTAYVEGYFWFKVVSSLHAVAKWCSRDNYTFCSYKDVPKNVPCCDHLSFLLFSVFFALQMKFNQVASPWKLTQQTKGLKYALQTLLFFILVSYCVENNNNYSALLFM